MRAGPGGARCSSTAPRCGRTSTGGRRERGALSQALGRSRGGYGSKALVAADGGGRAVLFEPRPGQASEARAAPAMLERLCRLGAVGRAVCDRGHASDPRCAAIRAAGAASCAPGQPTHPRAPPHDRAAYARRHRLETLRARLKAHRAIATRCDKTSASFMGALHLAAALDRVSDAA